MDNTNTEIPEAELRLAQPIPGNEVAASAPLVLVPETPKISEQNENQSGTITESETSTPTQSKADTQSGASIDKADTQKGNTESLPKKEESFWSKYKYYFILFAFIAMAYICYMYFTDDPCKLCCPTITKNSLAPFYETPSVPSVPSTISKPIETIKKACE